jgi:hypothetical protein
MSRGRSLRTLAILLLLVAACSRHGDAPAPSESQKPVEVVPPAGLVAELTVPDPKHFWTALRKLGGSRTEVLPSSFELTLFVAFDVPARVAGYVRPDTPVVGVLLAKQAAPPAAALGMRVTRGSELVEELTRPEGGFVAERDGSAVTVLVGDASQRVLGVVDDWLVAARDVETVRATALYLARSLGQRRQPNAPLTLVVSRAALGGPVANGVKARWAALRAGLSEKARDARAERGRAPDFGDPEAVLALADRGIGALVELLASSERLTLTLRPDDDRLELTVTLVPQPKSNLERSIDALEVGTLEPLAALPKSSLAVLSRSSAAERSEAAENPADALRAVLGARLSEKDAAPLADALRSIHRGRGSVTLVGLLAQGSVFLKQEAQNPKELERGIRGLVRMARVPALSAPLEPFVGKLQIREGTSQVAGVEGPVLRVGVTQFGVRREPGEILVEVRADFAYAVLHTNSRDGLMALTTGADPLRADPMLQKLAQNRSPAGLAVYADLATFLVPGRPSSGPAPALAVLGKKQREVVLEVALSAPACVRLLEAFGSP